MPNNEGYSGLDEQLALYCEGLLSELEQRVLFERIKQSAELIETFTHHLMVNTQLEFEHSVSLEPEDIESFVKGFSTNESNQFGNIDGLLLEIDRHLGEPLDEEKCMSVSFLGFLTKSTKQVGDFISRPTSLSITMAFIAIVSLLTVLALMTINKPHVIEPIVKQDINKGLLNSETIATITKMSDSIWANKKTSRHYGDLLREGDILDLKKGLVQVIFSSGTTATLQGPMRIRLDTDNSAFMFSGKSTFHVPAQAIGFRVNTHAAEIIDLGTQFGVSVSKNKTTTVKVKVGSVEVGPIVDGHVKRSFKRILNSGEMVEVEMNQPMKTVAQSTIKFTWSDNIQFDTYKRWQAYSNKLRNDPHLVAYYTFENQNAAPNMLVNKANTTLGRFNGVLGEGSNSSSRPTWGEGRWQGKSALRFDAKNKQRVFVGNWKSVPLKQAMTMSLWVCVTNQRPSNVIASQWVGAVPSSFKDGSGNVFFQLTLSGKQPKIRVSPLGHKKTKYFISNQSAHTKNTNRWVHLAFTIAANGGKVKLYQNGQLIKLENATFLPDKFPKVGTPLVLGGRANGGSCFSGLIDEVIIFDRVLDTTEIKRLYKMSEL